jgi:hypothetical protein
MAPVGKTLLDQEIPSSWPAADFESHCGGWVPPEVPPAKPRAREPSDSAARTSCCSSSVRSVVAEPVDRFPDGDRVAAAVELVRIVDHGRDRIIHRASAVVAVAGAGATRVISNSSRGPVRIQQIVLVEDHQTVAMCRADPCLDACVIGEQLVKLVEESRRLSMCHGVALILRIVA